jgi:hypothetical protein
VASPAIADFGTITLDIKGSIDGGMSWHDCVCLPTCDPMSVQIQVWASATTGGSEGPNNGVQALYFDILGTCLDSVQQQPMVLDNMFTAIYLPIYGVYGLGFNTLMSGGTAGHGLIAGVGAGQGAPPGPPANTMPGALTANALATPGLPPVLIATGTVFTNGQCLEPCPPACGCPPDYVGCWIGTNGNGNVWKLDGNAGAATIVNDQFWVCTIPEPTTLILLAPALLALRRRR